MAKGQRSNKEAKKPKKDRSVVKPLPPGNVVRTVTGGAPPQPKKK